MFRTLIALSFLTLAGCNAITIGLPCEKRDDCAPSQDCFPAVGGFCSKGCVTEGSTQECPQDTVCTFLGGTSLGCSPYCAVDSDCRVNYECWEVANTGGKKACRPIGATR